MRTLEGIQAYGLRGIWTPLRLKPKALAVLLIRRREVGDAVVVVGYCQGSLARFGGAAK